MSLCFILIPHKGTEPTFLKSILTWHFIRDKIYDSITRLLVKADKLVTSSSSDWLRWGSLANGHRVLRLDPARTITAEQHRQPLRRGSGFYFISNNSAWASTNVTLIFKCNSRENSCSTKMKIYDSLPGLPNFSHFHQDCYSCSCRTRSTHHCAFILA